MPPSWHLSLTQSSSAYYPTDEAESQRHDQPECHPLSPLISRRGRLTDGHQGEEAFVFGEAGAEEHYKCSHNACPPPCSNVSDRTMDAGRRNHYPSFPSSESMASSETFRDAYSASDCSAQPLIHMSASEKRYVPPLFLIGSVLGILCCTAGMATIMVLWIYTHRLPLQSPGVIYLREGDEDDIAREYTDKTIGKGATLRFDQLSSHPTSLTLSSVIVFLTSWSLYPMMGLIAYGLASDWIKLQERVAAAGSSNGGLLDQLPSPLQYALLTRLCSLNSISSIVDTIQHWSQTRQLGKRGLPAMLKKALYWLMILLFLQSSIVWLDFFMHETTRTVSVVDVDATTSEQPYSMAINHSLCPLHSSLSHHPCLVAPAVSSEAKASINPSFAPTHPLIASQGWLVVNKASLNHAVQTYVNEDDDKLDNMAFYTHPGIGTHEYMEDGHSIGLQARCSILTNECRTSDSGFDCARQGRPELARPQRTVGDPAHGNGGYSAPSNVLYIINASGAAQHGPDAWKGVQTNPWKVSGLIVYPFAASVDHSGFEDFNVDSSIGSPKVIHSYGAFECEMAFLDLQMSYFNQSYEIHSSKPSPVSVAHSLSGPLAVGLVTNVAFSAVASVAGRVNQAAFSRSLEQSLSYSILALSAGLISQEPVTIRGWRPILAQQYDLPILFGYIALLYAYALTTIVLFAWAWGTSSTCVVYQDKQGEYREVPAVFLAQSRLMEPASHLIAMHLAGSSRGHLLSSSTQQDNQRSALCRTAKVKMLSVFDDLSDQECIVVGLENNGRGFGVWPMSSAGGTLSASFLPHRNGAAKAKQSLLP